MVMLRPLSGRKTPSVWMILFRASYTPLYWALGSGCRLCIRVLQHKKTKTRQSRFVFTASGWTCKHLMIGCILAHWSLLRRHIVLTARVLGSGQAAAEWCVSLPRLGQLFVLLRHAKLSGLHKACFYLRWDVGLVREISSIFPCMFPSSDTTIKYHLRFRSMWIWELWNFFWQFHFAR